MLHDRRGRHTDATGDYTIIGLPTGNYQVQFTASGTGLVSEYYDNKTTAAQATPVAVVAGADTPAINASLEQGGSISGHVTNSSGDPLANVSVSAQTLPCCSGPSGFASTDAAGNYKINGLPTGNYQVQFTPSFGGSSGLLGEYYNNTTTAAQANPVAVVAGADTPAINASLEQGGSISGHVTNSNGDPLAGVNVSAQTVPCCGGPIGPGGVLTDAAGNYTIIGLATGSYQVQFTAPSGIGLVSEYYDNKTTAAQATPVAVVAGADTGVINAELTSNGPPVVPGAPTAVTGVIGNGTVAVSWLAPLDNGGSTVTGYTVTSNPGVGTCTTTGALSCTVSGLTNGTAYTFTVFATNAIGDGPPSAPSAPVTPLPVVPGAPTAVTGVGGNGTVAVSWLAPLDNGGSTVTGYTVTSSPGVGTCTTTGALSCTVSGLTNGTAYTFTVFATNAIGDGPPSAPSAPVTPLPVVPGAPTAVTGVGGNGTVAVSWLAPRQWWQRWIEVLVWGETG